MGNGPLEVTEHDKYLERHYQQEGRKLVALIRRYRITKPGSFDPAARDIWQRDRLKVALGLAEKLCAVDADTFAYQRHDARMEEGIVNLVRGILWCAGTPMQDLVDMKGSEAILMGLKR